MRSSLAYILLGSAVATASTIRDLSPLYKRDSCTDLSISSNNGDRKVAVVIDSSGSMAYNDPNNLRLAAGRALADFLVSNSEAGGSKKPDQLTVINFDDQAYLDYPLGDPAGANSSFDKIDALGGTLISSGIRLAIEQLSGGSGATDKRSAIVVFTDGEDEDLNELVYAIGNATAAGIRVSFGFLDGDGSEQPSAILDAIRASRGVYATITVAAGSQNFINYCLLNGLTYNDNPQGYDSQLLSGLSETHFVSNSDTVTLKYAAQQGENVNFTVTSISAGLLTVVAQAGGQTLSSSTTASDYNYLNATAPSTGEIDVLITASNAPANSMFSVVTNSNVPFKNCTVGVTGDAGPGGLSSGAKAGLGVGITAALLGIGGLGGYFLYKHFMAGGNSAAPNITGAPSGGEGNITSFGGEKPMPHTGVYPIDPGAVTPTQGYAPLGGTPSGYEATLTGPPPPDVHTAAPNFGGQGGGATSANLAPSTAPFSPSGLPPTSPPPTYPTSAPPPPMMAFAPPMVPPNGWNPNSNKAGPKSADPLSPNHPGPYGPNGPAGQQWSPQLGNNTPGPESYLHDHNMNGYQNPMGPNNGYQNYPSYSPSTGFQPSAGADGVSHYLGGGDGASHYLGGGNGSGIQQPLGGGDGVSHYPGGGADGVQQTLGGGGPSGPSYNPSTGFQPSAGGDGVSHYLGGGGGSGVQQPLVGGDGSSHYLGGGSGSGIQQPLVGSDGSSHYLGGGGNGVQQPLVGSDGASPYLGGGGPGSAAPAGGNITGGPFHNGMPGIQPDLSHFNGNCGGDLTGGMGHGVDGGLSGASGGQGGMTDPGTGAHALPAPSSSTPSVGFDGLNHTGHGAGGMPTSLDCTPGLGGGAASSQPGFTMPGIPTPAAGRRRRSEDDEN